MNKTKKAFTLIELLVVIAIIAVLATLAVVALQNSRANARDAKRLADVKQMQTALELYFNDNKNYPTSITSAIATSGIVYMATIPVSPTPVDGDCTEGSNSYVYSSDGSTYSIAFCLGRQTAGLSSGKKVLTRDGVSSPPQFVCGDVYTDNRDSQQYPTIQIGTQCWMAQNMNYDNGCASVTWTNADVGWCGCYSNNESNCVVYKKLYQWSAAMAGSTTLGAQGICPSGWHIPTPAEFTTLSNYLGGNSVAGGKLKQTGTSRWYSPNTGATNESGFTALPAGYRGWTTNFFDGLTGLANFWTSSKTSDVVYRYIQYNFTNFYESSANSAHSYSVRCLKD